MKFNKRKLILYTIFFLLYGIINAQSVKLKKVSLKDLRNNTYKLDSTANAVILYKSRATSFEDITPEKWQVVTEVRERVKILQTSGIKYGTKVIKLRKSRTAKDSIIMFKGYVYKEEGARLKKIKIKKENLIIKNINPKWDELIIKSPNIEVGSIVEWTYKITSPFWDINNLIIQEDIPTSYYFANVRIPYYFSFNRIINGYIKFNEKESNNYMDVAVKQYSKKYTKFMTGTFKEIIQDSVFQVLEKETIYELKDIPALKKLSFTDNINNYRAFIGYELVSTDLPGQGYRDYSTSWEKLLNNIYESGNLEVSLESSNYISEEAKLIKSKSKNPEEIIKNALAHIKHKMSWNGNYGVFTKHSLEEAYQISSGNVAEINLTLINLLRLCGIEAYPVLTRTRDQGVSFYINQDSFNYIIAYVIIDGEYMLLDATEKYSTPNVLPVRVLNGAGTIIYAKDNMKNIRLSPYISSEIRNIMEVTINECGSVFGKINTNYMSYDAMEFKKELNKSNNFLMLSKNKYGINNIKDYNIKNKDELNKVLTETFSFSLTNEVDIKDNQISFSPLFFLKLDKNPFKLKKRDYPINFSYPRIRKKVINIHLPDGYKVVSLPKPIKITLPERMGTFMFNISEVEGGINVLSLFSINSAIIPSYRYLELKNFFRQRLLKEAEKVILIKK